MSQFQKAADDIKSFASRIQGFLDVAKTLEKIGTLEQAESEATVRADRARQDASAAGNDLLVQTDKLSKVNEQIEAAKKSADDIIANAKSRGMSIVDEAGINANDLVRVAGEKRAAIEKEISDLRQKLAAVVDLISEKEGVLGAISAKIEAAKEKVASLFK